MIRAFDARRPELTLSEVARHCDLTRAAARRFLLTLADLGYVRTDGRMFRLTPRVLELGYAYLSSLSLPEVAAPHLERLVEEVHESSSMSVLDGDDIVYVARVPMARIMTVAINVGTRFPAYATSMGRVLLAALPDKTLEEYLGRITPERTHPAHVHVAEPCGGACPGSGQGYSIVDQELEGGLRAVAAPVRDKAGATVAAITSRRTRAGRRWRRSARPVPKLRAAAARIEPTSASADARESGS